MEENAADPVSSEQALYAGALPGLLKTLDPHSVFFDPGKFDRLQKMESSTQKVFGSIVTLVPGKVVVLPALPGTPSAKSGLAEGYTGGALTWITSPALTRSSASTKAGNSGR